MSTASGATTSTHGLEITFNIMKSIWKYSLDAENEQTLSLPKGAKIIHTGLDPSGTLCIWAEVNIDEAERASIAIYIYGTGHPIKADVQRHLGSLVVGPYVWHVYLGT